MAQQPAQTVEPDSVVGRVMRGFEEDSKAHVEFSRAVDRRYRAYRGILERRSEAASWTNKQAPKYVLQVIETMIAAALDPNPSWKVKARPKIADPATVQQELAGAHTMELLLGYQQDIDHFGEKQREFVMQGFIAGLTVGKNYWRSNTATRTRLKNVSVPVKDMPGFVVPQIQAVPGTEILHDDPTMEVVDVRDFIWHEAATSLEKAMRVTHRCWYSMDELRQLEAAGVYENVDQLSDTQDFSKAQTDRENQIYHTNRAKNQVEVLEQWFYDKGEIWVVTVGNRKVCLTPGGAAKPNPFWHGGYPFVVTSSMPDLFRIPGISEVEVIQDLQEMLWTLGNQRLDNLQLLNNAIAIIRSDVDDPDAYVFAPGERWLVDDPAQVKFLETPPITAELALTAESAIKQDMMNISGGMPLLGGDTSQMSNNTATGASTFATLAQRRVAAKKQNYTWAYNRVGEQWIALNQQFIREPRVIEIVGQDGAPDVRTIDPMQIQGRFHMAVQSLDESMMRAERRAESQALLSVAVNSAAALAATGSPLNLKAFMDKLLESYDIDDTTVFYSQNNPLNPGQGGPKVSLQGKLTPEQEMTAASNAGLGSATAPQATDPNSPSNAFSQSPVAATQRMAALAGGLANNGGH